jgi:hypothetical protein
MIGMGRALAIVPEPVGSVAALRNFWRTPTTFCPYFKQLFREAII